ncbi:hypothetical protein BBP40_006337 [Aspergillus hancockii]|nr:hypothetical protein BBP40_006337 [Aspergillus hancockii]
MTTSIPMSPGHETNHHTLPDIFTEVPPYHEFQDFELGDVFAHAGTMQEPEITPDNNRISPLAPLSSPPPKEPYTALDDLLRSTSQLATQRALYMTTSSPTALESPHNPPTTLYTHSHSFHDECSSPATTTSQNPSSYGSEDDWDVEPRTPTSMTSLKKRKLNDEGMAMVYTPPTLMLGSSPESELSDRAMKRRRSDPLSPVLSLPDEKPLDEENDEDDLFTPLEMPDGSTRFTSNWLPVDPEGGFTIGMPSDYADYSGDGAGFDPMAGIGREAFLSVGD